MVVNCTDMKCLSIPLLSYKILLYYRTLLISNLWFVYVLQSNVDEFIYASLLIHRNEMKKDN